jgi:hypothetical protein
MAACLSKTGSFIMENVESGLIIYQRETGDGALRKLT